MRRVLALALLALAIFFSPFVVQDSLAVTLPPQQAQYVAQVAAIVNTERQTAGLPPLTVNAALTRAAQDYAGVLGDSDCFAHTCGSTMTERINGAGYANWTAIGENIALGQGTPEAVMAAWMNSPGHRGNILGASYKEIGVGLAAKPNGALVWVQTFGASRNSAAVTPTAVPTSTPVPTATAAPTATTVPTAPVTCTPRPQFSVRSRTTGPGVLEVTVTAGAATGATRNSLVSIRVGTVVNSTVDVNGYGRVASGGTVRLASGVQQATLVVHRVASGAATVPLFLTDGCGEWRTFVGAGANAL